MKRISFIEKYGPWALITGGASGIGAEFGRQLACQGLNLVLVDVQAGMMRDHAAALNNTYGIEVRTVIVDLSEPDFMDNIRPVIAGLPVGLLVNNAGFGSVGEFMKTDIQEMLLTVAVNCRAPMVLARELGPTMMERGRGGIIFLSSSSAVQGAPIIANYAGTKAYNLILAEALWEELRLYGVDVLAICPGATNTPALSKSGACVANVPGMPIMEPGPVVAEALEALGRTPSVIAGRMNRIGAFVMTRLLSRRRAVAYMGKNTRKLYPGK
jgi:short-subunit dehydrogenase